MKDDFYDKYRIFIVIPELKKYIPNEACDIGVSKAGNIKYLTMYDQIKIVDKEKVPSELRLKLKGLLAEPSTIPQAPERTAIATSDFRKFDFDVLCPSVSKLYIRERDISYIMPGGRNRRSREMPIVGKHSHTAAAIKDVVEKYLNGTDIRFINTQINRSVGFINTNRPDFILHLYEQSAHLANLTIDIEKPCVYFRVYSQSLFFDVKKSFRLDKNITVPEINEWLDEQAKKLVNKKNEEIKKTAEQLYIKQFNQALKKKLLDNGFKIEYETVSNSIEDNTRGCVESRTDNLILSLKFAIKYTFKDEYIKEVKEDSGLIKAIITSAGKKNIEKETSNLYKKLFEYKWKIKPTGKLLNSIDHCISECNRVCKPILNGENKPKDIKYSYDFKKRTFHCENRFFEAEWKKDALSVKHKEDYKKLLHETSLKRYQQAREYMNKCLAEQSVVLTYSSGQGILYGETNLSWHCGDLGENYIWKCPSYKNSLPEWKKQVDLNIKEIVTAIKTKIQEKEREFKKKYGGLIDSFIAHDAAVFVKRNEEYITENAVIHFLRGLSNTFGGNITETDAGGRYKPISSDDVEDIIDSMIYKDLFRTVTMKGTYGRFDVLKSTPELDKLIQFKHRKRPEKELLELSWYNDYDAWNLYTLLTAKEELDVPDYMQLIKLIPSKGFVCYKYTDFIDIFKKAPDAVKTFLKMKKEMTEDNYEKKLINQMLKK